MKYSNIMEIISEYNGIITTKMLKQNKISKYYINKLIADNIIERIEMGLYIKTNNFSDEYYSLQYNSQRIVFSFNTALSFINKTEIIPYRIDITVPKGFNAHRINKKVNVHYVPIDVLYLGAITTTTPYGNQVVSYNLERCICDIIRSQNTGIDVEHVNKIIRNAFYYNQINYNTLVEYAKKLKCDKKLMQYVEVLI